MFQQLAVNYSYNYNFTTSGSGHSVSAGLILTIVLAVLFGYVIYAIALWKVFEKAGRPGWPALIPLYQNWVMFEIAGKPGWWALIGVAGVIPLLGIFAGIAAFVLYIIAMLELGRRFGKSTVFTVFGLIIFNIVGLLILGFGKDKYQASAKPENSDEPEPSKPLPPKSQTTK